jgi:poly(beta-D-mannuronate) lyase
MIILKRVLAVFFLTMVLVSLHAANSLVHTQEELNNAIKKAMPGDRIILAKGEWKNTAILFEANGSAGKPITIEAEEAGKTLLTGNSSLRFAGDYLVVNGLRFSNGYTAAGAIVEFRKNEQLLANHCRFTNCVIDNYSKPERFSTDSWIIFWGKQNRIDHCTIGDKLNAGTTVIVELNDERSQQNYHSIDSNHFYKRSVLGSNGGELMRVGVSRYSLTPSYTTIAHNYFEQVSGEVEIISIKSCYNTVSQNSFFECEGGLVLRHGNHNIVDGNLFICNNKPFTGGVRVINPDQTVTNNLVLNSAGVRFRSALGVLNGVPNSQINRYYQVVNSTISHNSFINCAAITFGAGKDNERTAAPKNVTFSDNFISATGNVLYEDLNNDGGMIIKNNAAKTNTATVQKGFVKVQTKNIRWKGLSFEYPVNSNAGADLDKVGFVERDKVGAAYFTASAPAEPQGRTISVSAQESKKLPGIISSANRNDIIRLTGGGRFEIDAMMKVNNPITIIAEQKTELVNVGEKSIPSFISIENGGSLTIEGVSFNSAYQSYGEAQGAIITSTKAMVKHYQLVVKNCEFYSFNENNYACFRANKSTFADSVVFENCLFRNMSGAAMDLSSEREDKGIYNAEKIIVRNCIFNNMLAGAINIYRGGNDESTTGPFVTIDHCTFNDVDNREQGCVIKLMGVQYARITNNIFNQCGQGGRSVWFEELPWDDVKVDYNNFYRAGRVQTFQGKLMGAHNTKIDPALVSDKNGSVQLPAGSVLRNKASDGKSIGAK